MSFQAKVNVWLSRKASFIFYTFLFTIFTILYYHFINRDKAITFKELINLHQNKEASLQDKLHKAQIELKNAVDMKTGRAAFGSGLYICICFHLFSVYILFMFCRNGFKT